MRARFVRILRRGAVLLAVSVLTLLALRAYDSQRGPPLAPWHTYVPPELRAEDIDGLDWAGYLQAEDAAFEAVRAHVTSALDATERVPFNLYFDASPIHPPRLSRDWNRSYVLEPDGAPVGAVVLLHGLTDSPYSMRHIARRYAERGWVAVAIRLPAHGTVPGALTDVEREDWQAATRLAVREARRRAGPSPPLHLVGYSNGGHSDRIDPRAVHGDAVCLRVPEPVAADGRHLWQLPGAVRHPGRAGVPAARDAGVGLVDAAGGAGCGHGRPARRGGRRCDRRGGRQRGTRGRDRGGHRRRRGGAVRGVQSNQAFQRAFTQCMRNRGHTVLG